MIVHHAYEYSRRWERNAYLSTPYGYEPNDRRFSTAEFFADLNAIWQPR